MKYTVAFDIGTTAIKGVVVSDKKNVVFQYSLPLKTFYSGVYKEQNPDDWYKAFCDISALIFRESISPDDIRGIIMSGQMQDLILVDKTHEPLGNAILYSDGRAIEEAAHINSLVGEDTIRQITGNVMDASIPAAKLLWLRRHEEERYMRIFKVLGSSKDYIILKLCGIALGDITAASTFGLMDIHTKNWDSSLLNDLNINPEILPDLLCCNKQGGTVSNAAAVQTGFREGTPVYVGVGDAGASTLSAGITRPDEYNIYLGTSGWIATVSTDILSPKGVFNLAAISEGLYINVVPFLNAGSVHKWISDLMWHDELSYNKYDYADLLLEESEAGSGGLLFLPYLSGERFPVMNQKACGIFIGLNNGSSKAQLIRSCLEGVAFSIRQGLETMGTGKPKRISLAGGGAKTRVWCQIFADTFQSSITVPEDSSEYLPSIALCSVVFIDQGLETSYESFITSISGNRELEYQPSLAKQSVMEEQYRRYLKIYPAVVDLFS